MEYRLITFRKLKEMCPYKYYWGLELRTACEHDDVYEENTTVDCCKKNCPVWAKLRRGDEKNKCTACNGYGFVFTKELDKHPCDVCKDVFYKTEKDEIITGWGQAERPVATTDPVDICETFTTLPK